MELLQVPRLPIPLVQGVPQPPRLDALADHHDHQVVVQVAHFSGDAGFIAGFGGDEHQAARLAHLFQNLIQALPEQVSGVGVFILTVLPRPDDVEQGVDGLTLLLGNGCSPPPAQRPGSRPRCPTGRRCGRTRRTARPGSPGCPRSWRR